MALVKIDHYYPDYRDTFADNDIKHFDVYTEVDEKIGSVKDILVDENEGRFRYLIIDTGGWFAGKKVLLPIGRSRINYDNRRVYALGLTKDQAENLPEFNDDLKIDDNYEEQVRGVYRPAASSSSSATTSTTASANTTASAYAATTPSAGYSYDQEPALYGTNEEDHRSIKLYEERLIASKSRQKTGEVVVGKHVETETARVSVPVERERVVIERTNATNATPVGANEAAFHEGEMARVDVYEEVPDIHKQAFVREEVGIRKEIDRDTVNAEEQIRREELDVDAGGRRVVDESGRSSSDRR